MKKQRNNKRRLLKDLPFDNLTAGIVIWRGGRGHGKDFSVSLGETYYSEGGSSSRGITVFEDSSEEILKEIWDNKEWFEDADIDHIDFVPVDDGILLRFKSIDKDDRETLIKGLMHILPELEKGSYTWNQFVGIETSIKNN